MELTLPAIIILVLLAVAVSRYVQSRADPTRQRRLRYDERGQLVAVEEPLGQQPIHLEGQGSHMTNLVHLHAGTYKLQYRFPPDVLVKVDLWRDGDSETLVLKRGAGESAFTVAADGRCTLDIAPADDSAPWTLDITRLGLPSGLRGETLD
jgi:YD repeat-containing protein